MQKVILLCGVPGSGKSWVFERLGDKFAKIHNDHYIGLPMENIVNRAKGLARGTLPVIMDCPFDERERRKALEAEGLTVVPLVIVEKPNVVRMRYEARELKECSQATLTRAARMVDKALEWNAKYGTSEWVLKYLLDTTF